MCNSIQESNRKGKNTADETMDNIAIALKITMALENYSLRRFKKIGMCFSCLNYNLMGVRYINFNDGRIVCPTCHSLAVLDSKKANLVINKVREFYEEMKIEVDKKIPIFLVDPTDLDEADFSSEIRRILGFTKYTSDIIQSVTSCTLRGETIEVVKKAEKLIRKQEVTGMFVIYGLSVLQTGFTLAHEMMHAWLRPRGAITLDRKLQEGICNVMAHKWIDWYDFKADKSFSYTSKQIQFLEKLKRSIRSQIEENPCKIYGDGFREANRAVERYGLEYTLKFIVRNKRLPKEPAEEETENKTLRELFMFKLISASVFGVIVHICLKR